MRNNRGQLTPFYIIIIAILIMALMVTVNIGKVGLHRVRTANASDSAALAGASIMANGLSLIGGISTKMFYNYLVTATLLGIPCLFTLTYAWILYASFMAEQMSEIWVAGKIRHDSCDSAEDTAAQFAFINAGINEDKPRNEGESYDDWVKRRGTFGQWMKDKKYENLPHEYSWEESEGQVNKVTVDISRPNPDALTCIIPIILPSGAVCGTIEASGTTVCVCVIPVWYIMGILEVIGVDDPIRVRVSRLEPDKDLGLWNMRYGSIHSYAEAVPYGGAVMPEGGEFDSQLIKTE